MREETTYRLKVKREGDVSDHSCDYKTMAETTYRLEVERVSDCYCEYKTRTGTYQLEVERGRRYVRLQNKGKDDVQPGGGEGVRRVRSYLQLQNEGRDDVRP
jgi:hypothetical protein